MISGEFPHLALRPWHISEQILSTYLIAFWMGRTLTIFSFSTRYSNSGKGTISLVYFFRRLPFALFCSKGVSSIRAPSSCNLRYIPDRYTVGEKCFSSKSTISFTFSSPRSSHRGCFRSFDGFVTLAMTRASHETSRITVTFFRDQWRGGAKILCHAGLCIHIKLFTLPKWYKNISWYIHEMSCETKPSARLVSPSVKFPTKRREEFIFDRSWISGEIKWRRSTSEYEPNSHPSRS